MDTDYNEDTITLLLTPEEYALIYTLHYYHLNGNSASRRSLEAGIYSLNETLPVEVKEKLSSIRELEIVPGSLADEVRGIFNGER